MAYLICNESFQGLKNRLKNFKGRLGNSTVLNKLKATLKDSKVRKGLAIGGGYLALSKLDHYRRNRDFDRNIKARNWMQDGVDTSVYYDRMVNDPTNANYNIPDRSKPHFRPEWDITSPISMLLGNQLGVRGRNESTILVPGTYVYNEGIIDDAKNKVSGAIDSVGDFFNSAKKRVQTNVGNIANGITSVTDKIKGVASGIADGVGNIGKRVSDFASNTIGSNNVKPVNNKPGFKVKPVKSSYYNN